MQKDLGSRGFMKASSIHVCRRCTAYNSVQCYIKSRSERVTSDQAATICCIQCQNPQIVYNNAKICTMTSDEDSWHN